MKISKGTITRTALLLLAIANNALAIFGKSPLPIQDENVTEIISFIFTMVTSLTAWWKNNDFTEEAIKGTAYMKELKDKRND